MELKQVKNAQAKIVEPLLIVPYGIETGSRGPLLLNIELLIVPYGIETFHLNVNRHRLMFF